MPLADKLRPPGKTVEPGSYQTSRRLSVLRIADRTGSVAAGVF